MTPVQYLRPDGDLAEHADVRLTDQQVFEGLRVMLLARAADQRALSLQRQGRFGTFAPVIGQEAAFVGSDGARPGP